MGNLVVAEAADDVDEDIGLAQGVEECARFHFAVADAGQVDEIDGGGHALAVRVKRGQAVQAGVGDRRDVLAGLAAPFVGVRLDLSAGKNIK